MRPRILAILVICLLAALAGSARASQILPPEHWAYSALHELEAAGLLLGYPGEWIAAGHPLTRHECAFYIRAAIMRLGQLEDKQGKPAMATPVELALSQLVAEFAPELHAFGVNVEPWSAAERDDPVFVDLDCLLGAIGHRPEVPPANAPPGGIRGPTDHPLEYQVTLAGSDNTYRPYPSESFSIPLADFGRRQDSTIGLAGEVLGVEWTIGLEDDPYQEVLGVPLYVGGFVITDEKPGIQGGFGMKLGDQLGVGFGVLWFLDLDQAQIAMDLLLLDVKTRVEVSDYLGLFGGLALEYRPEAYSLDGLGSQASAGLRVLLSEDLYLIAEYSLANPFSETLPHWQGTTLGLSLGDVGLLLLGVQAMDLTAPTDLELTGMFIYRF